MSKRTMIIFSILFMLVFGITTATNHYFIHPPDTYIGNSNTHVFHTQDCLYGDKISEDHKVYLRSISEAIRLKYRPCKVCNPK